MNANHMLSANKVKLHGMTSTKWTTKDKITQYKGLIKLYTRDRKIIEMDTNVAEKKQSKELKKIHKEIEQDRKTLENAIRGDKQKLRNVLAEHRELQLAYQNSPPQKVIDMVAQVNFNKRKSLDLMKYKMKLKTRELVDLKLGVAEKEDMLKMEGINWQNMLPCEQQAHIITGKVQDALLKKEAAIAIRHAYKEMIAIMRKDALYFDAILDAIRNDGLNQGKCMINATKLGQLATEYLDDRRQEFQKLEKVVKKDMALRKKSLEQVRKSVENYALNVRNLLRRDSDINLGRVELPQSESYDSLLEDMETVQSTLRFLKDAIFVPNLESIYPCLQQQVKNKERLAEFVETCEQNRDDLLRKTNHATLVKSEMENTMVDTTAQYKTDKKELLGAINEQQERIKQFDILTNNRHKLMADVRIALKHLQLLGTLTAKHEKPVAGKIRSRLFEDQMPEIPKEDELKPTKIIPDLVQKYTKLAANSKDGLKGRALEDGYKVFESMMYQATKPRSIETVMSEESLIETIFLDSHILSRDDIKKQSEEIVQANSKDDDFLPAAAAKKKPKFR